MNKVILAIIGIAIAIFLNLYGDVVSSNLIIITYLFVVTVTIIFFRGIGNRFVFLDFLCIIPVMQWLLGITIAKQIGLDPPTPFSKTYAYLFTGTLFYIIGLLWPWGVGKIKTKFHDKEIINLIHKKVNNDSTSLIKVQFIGGLLALLAADIAPTSIKFILQILGSYFFIATIKFIFLQKKIKWPYLFTSIIFILEMTLFQGMLGTIIFWSISLFLLFSIKYKINILKALPVLFFSTYMLMILYSSKTEYREETWHIKQSHVIGKEGKIEIKSSPTRLLELIIERVKNPRLIFTEASTLNMIGRINQAFQVALVMKRVPDTEPYANGQITLLRPISSLTPRFFWADKPILPDPADYKRFTGIGLSRYNSVTIGPIGEAYADFGKLGFIILFFYGLILRSIYKFFRERSEKNPYYLLWFLLIMAGAISHTETTIAGSFNSYIKIIIFVIIVFNLDLKPFSKTLKIS